jgi:hypothetical protein
VTNGFALITEESTVYLLQTKDDVSFICNVYLYSEQNPCQTSKEKTFHGTWNFPLMKTVYIEANANNSY